VIGFPLSDKVLLKQKRKLIIKNKSKFKKNSQTWTLYNSSATRSGSLLKRSAPTQEKNEIILKSSIADPEPH